MSGRRTLRLMLRGAQMSEPRFAELVGITEKHLAQVLSGQSGLSERTSEKMAEVLGVLPEVLYVAQYLERQTWGPDPDLPG